MAVHQLTQARPTQRSLQPYIYSPFGGIVAIVIGSMLALSSIPTDHAPRGALFWPGLWMCVGILFAPAISVYREPRSIIRGENILALIPVFWVLFDLVQGAYSLEEVERAEVIKALLAVATFSVALCVGRWIKPWKTPKLVLQTAASHLSQGTLFALIVICFSICIFRYAFPCDFNPATMLYHALGSRWAAPWGRGNLGGGDAFIDHLAYFGYLLPALTVMLALKTKWTQPSVVFSIILSLTIALFLSQGGGRRILGTIFGAGMVIWVLASPRHSLKSTIILLVSVGLVLAWMQVMIEYRGVGLGALLANEEEQINLGGKPPTSSVRSVEGEAEFGHLKIDDNFLRLAQLIELIPSEAPHVYHHYVIWVLVRPIPRVFWEGKPIGPGFDLPEALGAEGVSYSSSIIGELYMCAGFLCIFLGGLVYGGLAGMVNGILDGEMSPERALVYGLLIMALFAGGRSGIELVLMSYMLLAWLGVFWLHRLVTGRV